MGYAEISDSISIPVECIKHFTICRDQIACIFFTATKRVTIQAQQVKFFQEESIINKWNLSNHRWLPMFG